MVAATFTNTPSDAHASTPAEQRDRWRQRASWLSQLGLTAGDPVPVDAVEEVAGAVLALLEKVRRLELDRAEARAWAWSGSHGELSYDWVSLVRTYDGDPDQVPAWLADPRTPDVQEWWPAGQAVRQTPRDA